MADGVADLLAAHVFGVGSPCDSLCNSGEFPTGWVAEYLRLVRIASDEWATSPTWPKQLVAAVHFASWYLNLRYDVWRHSSGSANPQTERDLNSLRSPSEIFLMQGAVRLPASQA